MTPRVDTRNMALFCDFENVALGVKEARYAAFDIRRVLERLLLKGSIVVKKAYCDWERYKEFKAAMHEAAFELIEIPHVRQSGKNSADIRMVVDALDLCYTKSHVDTFVIISGDSDFSPLVSKLRENAKTVIGVGVKKSTSDLLIANCDEFIYYDDLVREEAKQAKPRAKSKAAAGKTSPRTTVKTEEERRQEAIDLVLATAEALLEERGEGEKVWGSMVKQAIKRRKPGFNERYHGFRTFGELLEEARDRGLLGLEHDEKSGGYIITCAGDAAQALTPGSMPLRGSPSAGGHLIANVGVYRGRGPLLHGTRPRSDTASEAGHFAAGQARASGRKRPMRSMVAEGLAGGGGSWMPRAWARSRMRWRCAATWASHASQLILDYRPRTYALRSSAFSSSAPRYPRRRHTRGKLGPAPPPRSRAGP